MRSNILGEHAEILNEYQMATEVLTLNEFAERLKVCPNTVRNWMATRKLIEGSHYFRAGRQYRFPWSNSYILQLMSDWKSELPEKPKLVRRPGRQNIINIKYCLK